MPTPIKMTSFNPHIFRAFYEWLIENDITPHLVVNADRPGVEVPRQFVQNGMIILSISPRATRNFAINRNDISFVARFQGKEQQVVVPYLAMQEIYALETATSFPIALWMHDQEMELEGETDENRIMEHEYGDEEAGMQFTPLQTSAEPHDAPQATKADKPKDPPSDGGPSFTLLKD